MDDALYPPQQGLPRGLLRLRENVCLALLRRLAVQPIHRAVDGVVLPVGELDGPIGCQRQNVFTTKRQGSEGSC